MWVPTVQVASALDDVPGVTVDVVNLDEGLADGGDLTGHDGLPASAAEVEFYVPPFFPRSPSVAAMRRMPRLRVVQTLTAGITSCARKSRLA
jgi:hypothetical protein